MIGGHLLKALVCAGLVLAGDDSHSRIVVISKYGTTARSDAPLKTTWTSALSILSYRLGLSSFYEALSLSDSELDLANDLRSGKEILFSNEGHVEKSQAVIFVEDTNESSIGVLLPSAAPAFTVSEPHPISEDLLSLLVDQHESLYQDDSMMTTTCDHTAGKVSDYPFEERLDASIRDLLSLESYFTCEGGYFAGLRIHGLKEISLVFGAESEQYVSALQSIRQFLQYLNENLAETTFIFTPTAQRRSLKQLFGFHTQQKRVSRARQNVEEEPLTEATSTKTSVPSSTSAPERSGNHTLPKGAILPICHPDKATAFKITKNCTDRGEVYLKYKSEEAGGEAPKECWACKCYSFFELSPSGSKITTHWAGPACQKQDISSAFFLVAGLTIVLVGTVSWGIGMLFSVGQEALPGVIGAGVAGPRAK